MQISEIFYSVQGEGLLSGMPSVFVRLQGCNLECEWCDTVYARNPGGGSDLSVHATLDRVLEYKNCRHCVITGGEPMLQYGELKEFTVKLRDSGKHVTIETNATLPPDSVSCDLASLSPKPFCVNADSQGPGNAARAGLDKLACVLNEWIKNFSFQLKFVVRDAPDIENVLDITRALGLGPGDDRVFLMPLSVGTDADDIMTARTVVELCKRYGLRYCHRIQKSLYGNCAGV